MGLGALQPAHLIVILVIVLLIFGPGKLSELGKAAGEGLRELKKATGGSDDKQPEALPTATVTPITAVPTAALRTCAQCRGAVPANDRFCGHCGATMEPVQRTA